MTRPAVDAGAFADDARAAGLTPVASPVMRIDYAPTPIDFEGVGAIALTSANGARALGDVDDARKATTPVYAVGEATAAAARAMGFARVDAGAAHGGRGDVVALADRLIAARRDGAFAGDVLHPAGAHRRGDLVTMLGEADIAARRIEAYAAIPTERPSAEARTLMDSDALAAVALFSPRTAALFVERHTDGGRWLERLAAACLSQAVADAARDAAEALGRPWRRIDVAAKMTSPAAAAAAARSFRSIDA
ncbi:MAG: uroporphyrinogen-III synthase [Parvularculaceae bacterium]